MTGVFGRKPEPPWQFELKSIKRSHDYKDQDGGNDEDDDNVKETEGDRILLESDGDGASDLSVGFFVRSPTPPHSCPIVTYYLSPSPPPLLQSQLAAANSIAVTVARSALLSRARLASTSQLRVRTAVDDAHLAPSTPRRCGADLGASTRGRAGYAETAHKGLLQLGESPGGHGERAQV